MKTIKKYFYKYGLWIVGIGLVLWYYFSEKKSSVASAASNVSSGTKAITASQQKIFGTKSVDQTTSLMFGVMREVIDRLAKESIVVQYPPEYYFQYLAKYLKENPNASPSDQEAYIINGIKTNWNG